SAQQVSSQPGEFLAITGLVGAGEAAHFDHSTFAGAGTGLRVRHRAHPDAAALDAQRHHEPADHRDGRDEDPRLERVVRDLQVDPALHAVEADDGAVVEADLLAEAEVLPGHLLQPALLDHAL